MTVKGATFSLCVASFLFGCCPGSTQVASAQNKVEAARSQFPWACRYFDRSNDADTDTEDDPLERDLDADVAAFYRLWCTTTPSTPIARQAAAEKVATNWKKLWYRENPFNASFHEVGSFTLLVLMGITHRVPVQMTADPAFMHDWLADCSERCFMIYGDDDPGARQEQLRMIRLREEVVDHLGNTPAAKSVREMLKNAKLDSVN
jgi:hypothetical protein